MNQVTRCEICGGPMNALDRGLCDRCCENLLADPETADEREPVYTLRRQFSPHQIATVRGTDGLLERVPKLDPDIYEILADGTVWGTATVQPNGDWVIDGAGFKAGPGYVII